MKLYKKQEEFVTWLTTLPKPRRAYLAAEVGTGKTPMSLRAAHNIGGHRILIITLAMIRRNWVREVKTWLGRVAYPIETGRTTKLTKSAAVQRDLAYAADIQVVSYDLLKHVTPTGWDAVIVDEAHETGSSASKQHRAVRDIVQANPQAAVLFLSATPMPTKVSQLWAQYQILKPGWAGSARPKTGDAPWAFLSRYSNLERNEYGVAEGLPNLDRMPELYKRLEPMTFRITREDIAPEQPPLLVSALELPKLNDPMVDATEWVEKAQSKKLVVLPYYVDTAERIVESLRAINYNVILVNGTIPTAKRDELLQQAAAAERCVLVATQDSVGVGIRFMWCEQALVVEARHNPGQVIQLLGRFQSVGSEARPSVQILCDADSLDKAQILVKRAAAFNELYRPGVSTPAINDVFKQKDLSEDALWDMISSYKEPSSWEDINDDT